MFAKSIVGTVNATAAGWGNLGVGVARQLVMPYVMLAALAISSATTISASWRLCFIVPLAMHVLSCIFHDRVGPSGGVGRELESSGAKQKVKAAARSPRSATTASAKWIRRRSSPSPAVASSSR